MRTSLLLVAATLGLAACADDLSAADYANDDVFAAQRGSAVTFNGGVATATSPADGIENCDNGVDDDGDGAIDHADKDCDFSGKGFGESSGDSPNNFYPTDAWMADMLGRLSNGTEIWVGGGGMTDADVLFAGSLDELEVLQHRGTGRALAAGVFTGAEPSGFGAEVSLQVDRRSGDSVMWFKIMDADTGEAFLLPAGAMGEADNQSGGGGIQVPGGGGGSYPGGGSTGGGSYPGGGSTGGGSVASYP